MTQAREAGIDKSISDGEVIETCNHVEMMKRAHLWSFAGKVLPLVRDERKYAQDVGMMFNAPNHPPFRVYLGNMFSVALGGALVADLPFIDYDSAEAAVADGWLVD